MVLVDTNIIIDYWKNPDSNMEKVLDILEFYRTDPCEYKVMSSAYLNALHLSEAK